MGCLKLTYSQENKPAFLKAWKNPKTTFEKVGLLDFHARFYDPAIVRTTTQDPMAESFLSESPYSFMENNPVVNIDPTGMSATRYEDEQGKLLLDTDDGSDAVVTVTDDKREGFDAAVKGTEDTDDVAWNNTTKKSLLGFELSGKQEGLLSQLNSDWSRKNAIAYWQNPTAGNAVAFAFSEALSQWTNPELVVLGLSAGATGLSSVPKTAKALSTNPKTSVGPIKGYTKHGLNQAISRNGGRGVNASAMKDAVMNPKKIIQQSGGRTKYVGNKATVILNSEGKVITTYGKSRGPVN